MTTVCLSFDFDAVSLWVSTFKQTTATPLSRGEYSANVGIGRVLGVLKDEGVKATFFVPAHTAVSFKPQVERVLDAGHEIGVHGFCHETPVGLTIQEEGVLLDRALKTLHDTLGSDLKPVGYRSPAWDLSNDSVALLVERGFSYDSSMMADDFQPYRARKGDRADELGFYPGEPTQLIELPVSWELDDYPYFHFTNRPLFGGLRNPDDVYQCWKGEFDYCHDHVNDGTFTLTMHPEIIGRGPRVEMLRRLITHMRNSGNVTFSTMAEEARRRDQTLPPIGS
jgi:peptidoglycan/xylan/chitin deacetylase (PgdA/CDA1 family)